MIRHALYGCWLLVLLAHSGCTSMSSTLFTRDEANRMWLRFPHLHGVPITLKVPTHLNVYVFERHYLVKKKVGDVETVERLKLPFVLRDFHHEFIYSEKIFTVDFKRPAAGLFNLRLDMTDDQYFDKVQHDVTDQTIEQVTAVVRAFAPEGIIPGVFPAGLDSTKINEKLEEIESVVAVAMFEIDDPGFEANLTAFLNCHLNQGPHDAFTVPSHVEELHRSNFPQFIGNGDLCRGAVPVAPERTMPPSESAEDLPEPVIFQHSRSDLSDGR